MYYRLLDLQVPRYMATGYNDENKEELKESLISYLSADMDEDEEKELRNMTVEEIANIYDFEIEENNIKFEEL